MRWVDKYKKDGELTGYNRIPKAYKVHKEHVAFLLHEKSRRIIYKIGVLNEERCKKVVQKFLPWVTNMLIKTCNKQLKHNSS